MKDYLLNLVKPVNNKVSKANIMREYLQIYALRTIFEKGRFTQVAFVGGTALRLIQSLPRFSEDLDFSLINNLGYEFEKMINEIKQAFVSANYAINIKLNSERTVHAAFLKFPELMFLAGLTHRKDQNLTIKLDIDTNPPKGGHLISSLVNKYFPITFTHYDLPSLFSGKLHAIFTRPYVKGRDYFDLVWLLSKDRSLSPNIELLNNALKQTNNPLRVTLKDWKEKVLERIESLDWARIVSDVEIFTEDPKFLDSMKLDYVRPLLLP